MSASRHVRLLALGLLFAAPLALPSTGHPARADDAPSEPAMGGGAAPGTDEPDGPVPFVEGVGKAIERGVAWLKTKQLKDGSFGPITAEELYDPKAKGTPYLRPAASTGLALYALLKCDVPIDDPVVKKGFNFLRTKYPKPGDTYEVSIVLLAVTATADPFKRHNDSVAAGDRVKLSADWLRWANELITTLIRRHKQLGWRYNEEIAGSTSSVPPGGNQDLSSTQLACLALYSAERCGLHVPSQIYADMILFARQQQEDEGPERDRAIVPKGAGAKKPAPNDPYAKPGVPGTPKDQARGFAYIKNPSMAKERERVATGAMTGCGLATILMSRYVLMQRDDAVWKKQDQKAIQRAIYDGYAWLDANWSSTTNPVGNWYHVYYKYCVERACDLTGNALIGKANWYVEMGQDLISSQKDGANEKEGFWDTASTHGPHDVLDTCFALLFLKRATKGAIPYPTLTGGSDDPPIDNRDK